VKKASQFQFHLQIRSNSKIVIFALILLSTKRAITSCRVVQIKFWDGFEENSIRALQNRSQNHFSYFKSKLRVLKKQISFLSHPLRWYHTLSRNWKVGDRHFGWFRRIFLLGLVSWLWCDRWAPSKTKTWKKCLFYSVFVSFGTFDFSRKKFEFQLSPLHVVPFSSW